MAIRDSTRPPLTPEAIDFARELQAGGPGLVTYVRELIHALEHDHYGAVEDRLKRHASGERVTDEYVIVGTGKRVRVAPHEAEPAGALPVFTPPLD